MAKSCLFISSKSELVTPPRTDVSSENLSSQKAKFAVAPQSSHLFVFVLCTLSLAVMYRKLLEATMKAMSSDSKTGRK